MDPEVARSSIVELVEAYRRAAAAEERAVDGGDSRAADRHNAVIVSVYRELRARGLAAQAALLPLMQDPNDAVRCWSAAHALEFAPERAEPVLEALAAGGGIVAFDAMMTLRVWRKGDLSFP